MADRLGVELARVGKFDLSTGPLEVTPEMLSDAARRAAAQGDKFRAALKLGHTDPRNDGDPAFGWLSNVRVEGSGTDTVLKGDLVDIPKWLDDSADWAYPHRSIEGNVITASDGSTGLEITGLALLGVTPPGMPTIESWRDLPKVLVAAAAAGSEMALTEFCAVFTASVPIAGSIAAPKPPAEPPVDPSTPTQKEADTMSDTITQGLRERLGVKDADLDETGLLAALDQALKEKAEPAPAELTPEAVAAAAAKDGKVLVSSDVLEELKISAAAGAEARAVQLRQERDQAINAAFRAGKIAAARKEHWAKSWDADPEGAKASLAELPVLYPVSASGGLGDSVELTDDGSEVDFDRIFSRPAPKEGE